MFINRMNNYRILKQWNVYYYYKEILLLLTIIVEYMGMIMNKIS